MGGKFFKIGLPWYQNPSLTSSCDLEYSSLREICDIPWFWWWFELSRNCIYLAILCNSTVIEMCDDMIRVSHGFRGCQMLRFIAVSITSNMRTGKDDILNFYGLWLFNLCWRNPHKIRGGDGWFLIQQTQNRQNFK